MKIMNNFFLGISAIASALGSAVIVLTFLPASIPIEIKYICAFLVGLAFSVAVIKNEQSPTPSRVGRNIIGATTVLGAMIVSYGSLENSELRARLNSVAVSNAEAISQSVEDNAKKGYLSATANLIKANAVSIDLSPNISAMFVAWGKHTPLSKEFWYTIFSAIFGAALETSLRLLSRGGKGAQKTAQRVAQKPTAQRKTQQQQRAQQKTRKTREHPSTRVSVATIKRALYLYDNAQKEGLTKKDGSVNQRAVARATPCAESTLRYILESNGRKK